MTAIEAKLKSSEVQYEMVMAKIDTGIKEGKDHVQFNDILPLLEPTIENLRREGYDVTAFLLNEDSETIVAYSVNFSKAEAEREGDLKKIPLSDTTIGRLFSKFSRTEDEQEMIDEMYEELQNDENDES